MSTVGGGIKGKPKPLGYIIWGPRMFVQNFMAIHPTVVDIFKSGPKWCTDQQIAISA